MAQAKSTKAPVICLHGFPGLPSHWDRFATELPDDREVYSLPMPWLQHSGVAKTGFPSVLNYIASVAKAALTGPAHFVGHDLGGVALYWLARTDFREHMKSLTFIAAPHPFAYRRFMASDEGASKSGYIDSILQSRDDAVLADRLLAGITGSDTAVTGDIGAALRATNFAALRALYAQIRQAGPQEPPKGADRLDCPVAMIHAKDDRYLPAGLMQDSAARFACSGATLGLSGDSHYPHLTDPARVAQFAEGFWNAVEP